MVDSVAWKVNLSRTVAFVEALMEGGGNVTVQMGPRRVLAPIDQIRSVSSEISAMTVNALIPHYGFR